MMMVMGMRTGGLRRDDGIQGMVEQKDGNWDIGGPLILTGSTVCSLISSHISTPHLWGIAVSISLPIKSHFCRFLWQRWELRYWRSIELDRTSAIACVGFVKDWYQEYLNLSAKKIHIFLFATKLYVAKKASGPFCQSPRKQFPLLENKQILTSSDLNGSIRRPGHLRIQVSILKYGLSALKRPVWPNLNPLLAPRK